MTDERKDLPPVNSPNFLEKVREAVSTYMGNRGDKLDRGLTVRDLADAGLIDIRPGYLANGGKIPPILGPGTAISNAYEPDLTPPPTPEGFTVGAAISNLFFQCADQTYTQGHGHSNTVVYGAIYVPGATYASGGTYPVFTDALSLTEFQGTVYSYPTNPATTWHLWIKWVSKDGVSSVIPAGGLHGQVATTGQDVALLLKALNGQIKESQLYADLGSRIDLIDGPASMEGSVAKQIYDEAQARNAAIAQEATDRAAAILVETNNRNLALDTINATLSDISGTPDYAAGVAYTVDEIVKYSGGLYKATATTTGNLPTNTSYWTKIGDYASLGDAVAGHSLILNDHETRITNTSGAVTAVAIRTTAIEAAVNSPTSGLSTKSSVAYVDTAKADAISTAASATQLVQSNLSTTNTNVATAQGTANTAVTNAATAQTTANTAVTAAAAVATRASTLEATVNNGSTGLGTKASISYVDTAKSDAISAAATASQTLVSSIKVGGRNLLTNSKTMTGPGWASNQPLTPGQLDPRGGTSAVKITANETNSYLLKRVDGAFTTVGTHTLSVWLKGNKLGSINIQTHNQTVLLSCTLTTTWQKFTVTGTVPSLTPDYSFVIGGWGTWTDTSLEVYAAYPKLEEGDKATDWTPAPEDVDAAIGVAIAAVATEANTRATADQTEANARTTLASTLRTEAEAGNAAAVTESKSYVDTNFYTKTNRDAAEAANNATLRAEFAASDAATLSSAQNFTYSKATIDGALTSQTNTITAAYKGAIGDIKVGGRNRYTSATQIHSFGDGSYVVSKTANGFVLHGIPVTENGVLRMVGVIKQTGPYTISFKVSAEVDGFPVIMDVCDSASQTITTTTTPTAHSLTFNVTNQSDGVYSFIDFNGLANQHYFFSDFKVEEGVIATSWTPAPEDTDQKITDVKSTLVNDYYTKANADTAIAGAVQTVSARLNAGGDVNTSIATAKTTADAAVTAAGAVASQVTTLQSRVGNGSNLIDNSEFALDLSGWYCDTGVTFTRIVPSALRGAAQIYESGYAGSADYYRQAVSQLMPVDPSKNYQVSAYLSAHRCKGELFIYWWGGGSIVGNSPVTPLTNNWGDFNVLAGYTRLSSFGAVPPGATHAQVIIRKTTTMQNLGYGDSYLFFTRAMFCGAAVGQTEPDEYSPGTSVASLQITAQTQATDAAHLYAQYTVKLDVGGKVSGYGLASTGPSGTGSAFAIRADRFYMAAPSGVAGVADSIPFIVQATPTTINGVEVPAGIYANDAYIMNGTITNAKIANLAVDDAKISSLAVSKLVAGSLKVGSYIQSTNYVAGTFGWKINADGTAELQNAIVRGAIYATSGYLKGLDILNAAGTVILSAGNTLQAQINPYESGATVGASFGDNIGGQITLGTASTYIANGAIGSAQIRSIALVGTANFNVKTATSGARMEMDASVIKVIDSSGYVRIKIGNLAA